MTQAKVYKGVACLEIASRDGGKWWYQGGSLAYTPVLIKEIKAMRTGYIKGKHKEVLVVPLQMGNSEHLVVVNLPRTDIVELKAHGLWPRDLHAPHETTNYEPWPEYTGGDWRSISLA